MRHRVTLPRDTGYATLGDSGWVGVDMRREPSQLPPGFASEAINMRFRNGVAETRKGFVRLTWANKISAGSVQPWGDIDGIGEFKDPNTLATYLVVSAGSSITYITRQCSSASALSVPSGYTAADSTTFTQAFDTLVMFRGATLPPLSMPTIDTGFQEIAQTIEGTYTNPIPNADRGLFFQNRLFIPSNNDEIVISDFGDYTRYLPVVNQLRINQGSSDSIVNIAKFNDTTMIVFKDHSIYALNNIFGDLNTAYQDLITDQFGLIAADSLSHCGQDLLFLSEMGVMSLRQTEDNKIHSVLVPLSEPIQPLIDRINWRYAANAQGAYWDNKYYLAVPLDEAEILGPELVAGTHAPGLPYTSDFTVAGLTVGATYRFTIGANEASLTCGSDTLTTSQDFVAQATTAVLLGIDYQLEVTSSIRRVYKGVNNAVLVYDFLNRAWCGHDEADQFSVKKLFTYPVNGVRRLLFVDHDGWIKMYEEDYEDHLSVPYVDIDVTAVPATGNTMRINSGTTVTAQGDFNNVAPNLWGATGSVAEAIENLWADDLGGGGYSPGAGTPWTAANTQIVPTDTGIRVYTTNGVLPVVVTTGSWATVTSYTAQSIPSTLVTRSYMADNGDLSGFDWLCLDAQTWNPNYALYAITDGVGETTTIDDSITKSRTAYTIFGRADFTATNVNGDHATDHREDYSVNLTSSGVYVDSGVDLTRHQEFREEFKVKKRGRACKVKIETTQGRIRVMGATLQNRRIQTQAGAKT
jgi:hypothetical protein